MSKPTLRTRLPLLLILTGSLLLALGHRMWGLIAIAAGSALYATGLHKPASSE